MNGAVAALVVVGGGMALERALGSEKTHPAAIATFAGAVSVGVNIAYEAGVPVTPIFDKPDDAPMDWPDAVFGGATGVLYSLVFCGVVLRQKMKAKKRQRTQAAHLND